MKAAIDCDKTKNVRGNRAKELLEHISELFTKEEVIAMLTDIKKEIDEIPINPNTSDKFKLGQATAYDKCEFLIQQKIDKMMEGKDGQGNNI